MRAGPAQDTIAFLDVHQPGLCALVQAQIGATALAKLTDPGRTDWIALQDDVTFLNGLVQVLGFDDAVAFFRASVAQHFQGPLLRALVRGAERIFGLTAYGLVKLIPRAWPTVYKGLGTPKLEKRSETHAVVTLLEAHPLLFESKGYHAAWQGIFEGVIASTDAGPASLRVIVQIQREAQRIEIHMHW